jgi:hypothetical protein
VCVFIRIHAYTSESRGQRDVQQRYWNNVFVYIRIHAYTYIQRRYSARVRIYRDDDDVCMYVYMIYLCMYIYIYVCIYMHIYVYVHRQTDRQTYREILRLKAMGL